jgi:nucleotide-binding universal stress UspA family protein
MMETILVGYDGTVAAERALTRAAELAKVLGSKVIVVSVAAPAPVAPEGGAFGLGAYYYPATAQVARTDEALWRRHRDHVEALFARFGVPLEFAGVSGSPVDEILDVADEHHVDLIVVGTRELGFLDRLIAGSVSQGIARRAHCDVLIVHAPDERTD